MHCCKLKISVGALRPRKPGSRITVVMISFFKSVGSIIRVTAFGPARCGWASFTGQAEPARYPRGHNGPSAPTPGSSFRPAETGRPGRADRASGLGFIRHLTLTPTGKLERQVEVVSPGPGSGSGPQARHGPGLQPLRLARVPASRPLGQGRCTLVSDPIN